jgi:sigma-E factor negative regulatory protein RseC
MIEEIATVVSQDARYVWLTIERSAGCGACQQQSTCMPHAATQVLSKKALPIATALPLNTGDQVLIAIEERALVMASLIVYILPLLALFIGAGMASGIVDTRSEDADLWIAGSAVVSFVASLKLINMAQQQLILKWMRPVIIRKLLPPQV